MEMSRPIVACAGRRDVEQAWARSYLISCGEYLRGAGCSMTHGGAKGSDWLFETGFITAPGPAPMEVYLPWMQRRDAGILFTADQAWPVHAELAELAHPAWRMLRPAVRKLMVRNAMLLERFGRPVDALWAFPDKSRRGWGGTGHTMRVASLLNIPVILLPDCERWDGRGC